MPERMTVTPAEWWEAQKRAGDVQNARLTLALAEQAQAMFQGRLLTARGLPAGDYELVLDQDAKTLEG